MNLDYVAAVDVELAFPANSPLGTQQCFNIPIIDDVIKEVTESFQLSCVVSDPRCLFLGPARVDIIDEDSMSA